MTIHSEPLDPARHDLASLGSGEPTLDAWLRDHAEGAEARRVGRTFVWIDDDGDPAVALGYYTLAGHRLVRAALPRSLGHGSPAEIPTVLLARLALDQRLQGHGHGGVLLVDALRRVLVATEQVAARFVVVDAMSEKAADFYAHHGFRRIPQTMRLVQKVNDIAAALEGGRE